MHRFESRFERWRPELAESAWREAVPREGGGGLLLDLGTHLVDQAVQLFGPVAEVRGEVDHRRGGPADDDVFIALRHESGVRSHLWASSVAAAPGPRMRVLGSEGAFVVDGLDGQEDALKRGDRPGEGWGAEPEERWGRLVARRGEPPGPGVPRGAGRSSTGAWPRRCAATGSSPSTRTMRSRSSRSWSARRASGRRFDRGHVGQTRPISTRTPSSAGVSPDWTSSSTSLRRVARSGSGSAATQLIEAT